MNKIPLVFAQLLKNLLEGQQLNQSFFQGGNRKLLEKFIGDSVLDYQLIGTQQRKIFCADTNNLRMYLHHKYEISSLEDFVAFLENENTSRSDAVRATSNSKYKNIKMFEGFLVNTYYEYETILNGNTFFIKPLRGSYNFISDYRNFQIPKDITIVGVEGYENFKEIERQKYLFEGIKPLFVWRYQNSNSIVNWINIISNNYLHFGDYDPKGLHIYISEFRNKIGADRCNFLVPKNLDSLMGNYGERELFENQIEFLRDFDFKQCREVSKVFDVITEYKKGLAQEILIQ